MMKKYPELDALLLKERDLLRALDALRGQIKEFKIRQGIVIFDN